MASGSKTNSRWGSFFEKAVAGVESRLDTILAEDDEKSKTKPGTSTGGTPSTRSARGSEEIPRDASPAKKTERLPLQERLAQAAARNKAGQSLEASNPPSRSTTPNIITSSPRTSTDSRPGEAAVANGKSVEVATELSITIDNVAKEEDDTSTELHQESMSLPRISGDSYVSSEEQEDDLPADASQPSAPEKAHVEPDEEVPDDESAAALRSALEQLELRRQQEIHEYVERNEALQAKVQYLTKEILQSSQRVVEEASAGTPESKIAQRDEKIALLIEEGQKLSQNELKLMNTIKRLRAKAVEDEKKLAQSLSAIEKADKSRITTLEKVKAAEESHNEDKQRVRRLEKDLERARADLSSRSTKIGELQSQLNQAKATASTEELTKTKKLLDEERNRNVQLQEDISTSKIEKKLSEDRFRSQVKELEEKANREKERARVADLELRGEIGVLESRLETYRAQAEEVSSSSSGDTQAKLFRQIETLQTQYSAASENWRGIESSLLARISGLEKERDEVVAKDSDLRRKNRETANKARRAEEDLEQVNERMFETDGKLNKEVSRASELRATLESREAELASLKKEIQAANDHIKSLQQDIEKKDAQLLNVPPSQTEPLSPLIGGMRSPTERSNTWGRRHGSSAYGLKDLVNSTDRTISRKSSTPMVHSHFSPTRQDSMNFGSTKGSTTQTPSIQTEQHDDPFDGVVTPATPERTINEMFSNSAAGAGPSVQLVERMSAAVRRLESEKAASKEEMERLHAQRDEAREQVVSLMSEVEEKRKVDGRLEELEKEVNELNQRYQTTLEMLGEKSERVEELQADIEDMKEIYKDTLSKSMK